MHGISPAHPRRSFSGKDSLKLDQIEALRDEGKVGEHICSLEEALESYLPVYTTAEGDKALKNGNPCFKQQLDLEKSTSLDNRENGNRYRMYSSQGILWGFMNTRKKSTGGSLENVYAGWRRKLMRYIADTVDFELKEPTVVTLGKFDGRHRGHQKLLRTMEEVKESLAMQLLFLHSVLLLLLL